LWAANQLVTRARMLCANQPDHHLLPADLSKHTKKTDPLHGGNGFDPNRHQTSWATAWESLKKAAGLEGLRFHDLRHSHITHAIEGGVPIEIVMAQVGHISPEMTRYYTHLSADSKHSEVAAVQKRGAGAMAALKRSETATSHGVLPEDGHD
jgi:integrase